MNIQRTKLYLWSAACGLMLATVGVGATASLWPYDIPTLQNNSAPARRSSESQQKTVSLPPLSTFGQVWSLNLRRPLIDEPKVAPTPAKKRSKPTPPLSARLAGTVVEPGHSIAMFITKNGKIELKGIGEKVGGAEVIEITSTGVSLKYHEKVIDLALEQNKKKKRP